MLVIILMMINMITLFSSNGSSTGQNGNEVDDIDMNQIDSSSGSLATGTSGIERYRSIVELFTYFSVMTLSFMQERRQFVDAWYC